MTTTIISLPGLVDVPSLTEADVRSLLRWFRVLDHDRGDGLRGRELAEHWLKIVRAIPAPEMSEGQCAYWEITRERLETYLKDAPRT